MTMQRGRCRALHTTENVAATFRTMSASPWELFKVRLFGERIVTEDDGFRLVTHRYKGLLYFSEFKKIE